MIEHTTLLYLGTSFDKPYLSRLKSMVGSTQVYVITDPIHTWAEVSLYCKKRDITGVFTSSQFLLEKLLESTSRKKPSLDNYAGSMFVRDGIEIVFIDPLKQLISVSYGPFMARKYISKLTDPYFWRPTSKFNWELLTSSNEAEIFSRYQTAIAIAVDIETFKNPVSIRCIGYTAIFPDLTTHSCVLPMDSLYALAIMRKFNWELKVFKILQNGKYDISYLSRYNAVPYGYMWDTATMFHCLYSELPKDLAFLTGFYVRHSMYWKDLAETNDLMEYYKYNALDTWGTAQVFIGWMLDAPQWAKNNYLQEFPLVFPCHLAEMTGVKRDFAALEATRTVVKARIASASESLCKLTATPRLNSNSPKQVKQLLTILGCGDLESSDESNLKKAALRHPINSRVLNKILDIRGDRKLLSTYLRTDEDITSTSKRGAKEFKGRILYALNPHGTDTGRLASREHHFWCGLQVQNIPRGKEVKQTIVADEGFLFAEVDLEQAESRDTAYASGDTTLIAAVSGTKDFHSVNASAFFGVSYSEIYSDIDKKPLAKGLRDLAKRVNHGANYLMGAGVLIDTMGEDKVLEAKRLLNLPKLWTLTQVAEHLLAQFHKTYPELSRTFYPHIVHQVVTTQKLVSATGWTRYCFGHPDKNKSDKNAYVAHVPQNLNAMTLNKAFMKVFYELALKYPNDFKLCAQIHDSILFQYRIGHEHLAWKVKEYMEIPVTITAVTGVEYTFTVPAAVKLGGKYWSDLG